MRITILDEQVNGCYKGISGDPKDPDWIYLFHGDPRNPSNRYNPVGRHVFHRPPEELERIVDSDLSGLVAAGTIKIISFRPKANDPTGPYKDMQPPLCAHAAEEDKEIVRNALSEKGIEDTYWLSNR